MAHTSVKISANSSDYQSQMKSAASQMKVLSSEFKLAQTQEIGRVSCRERV